MSNDSTVQEIMLWCKRRPADHANFRLDERWCPQCRLESGVLTPGIVVHPEPESVSDANASLMEKPAGKAVHG